MKSLIAAGCLLACFAARGEITYVDASPANTTLADGTPLVLTTSPALPQDYTTSAVEGTAIHRWHLRTGLANEDSVWSATSGAAPYANDCPALRTTLTGLEPGASYDVSACYWVAGFNTWPSPGGTPSGNNAWDLRAGPSAGALANFGPAIPGSSVNLEGRSGDFAGTVLTEEGNRRLFRANFGTFTADAAGEIRVFIDDLPGNDDRTWYDGLSHQPASPPPAEREGIQEIAANGAWTWFNDERAIFHGGKLFAGYVLNDGRYGVTRYDPATRTADPMIVSTAASQQKDDHNNPSLTVLPDGRLLAVYSKHGGESKFYYRTSKVPSPAADADWNSEQSKATPAGSTYANTFRLSAESDRIYNFHRCINYNPTLTLSTNNGSTWGGSSQLIASGSGNVRPYVRYGSNLSDRIDMIYTDGHPRDVNNSIYHLYYRAGNLHRTDGTVIDSLASIPLDHDAGERGSVVYPYTAAAWGPGDGPDDWLPSGRAWTWDVHYGASGHPVCAFQVQRDNVTGSGWNHDRIYYYYARWTGTAWQRRFIAHGGRGLYQSEDDYGGGMCIDPEDPRVVYLSTNAANPFHLADINNVPLAVNDRYEIWRGFTADGGLTFAWTPVTRNSVADNLRPIVPEKHGRTRCALWFQGSYASYTNYSTRVLGLFGPQKLSLADWAAGEEIPLPAVASDFDHDGLEDLLEYALGGDPKDASDRPMPLLQDGAFEFRRLDDRTDVEYVVETCEDLEDWEILATFRNSPSGDEVDDSLELAVDGDTVRLSPLPVPGGPRSFVRLRVVQVAP